MNKFGQTGKFLISLVAALIVTWVVMEPSFSQAQTYVLFLLCFSIGLWLTEAVPPFAVGLFIFAYLAFTLGSELFTATPQDVKLYLNTFSSSVIWLMMGGFFLASAMTKTRLDADLIRITMKMCGSDSKRVLFGLMMVTAFTRKERDEYGLNYPSARNIREVSVKVAVRIAEVIFESGRAGVRRPKNIRTFIERQMYQPVYR